MKQATINVEMKLAWWFKWVALAGRLLRSNWLLSLAFERGMLFRAGKGKWRPLRRKGPVQ